MPRPTEPLDLYAVDPSRREVDYVDGFSGMEAAIAYLKSHPDGRCFVVTDIAFNIRAVAFYARDQLLLLQGGGV